MAWENLPNLKSEPQTDYDLTQLINSMINCQEIVMSSFDDQVEQIHLENLKKLHLIGKNSARQIYSIKDHLMHWIKLNQLV